MDFTESSEKASTRSHFNVCVKSRSRRKAGLQKALSWKYYKSEISSDDRADKHSYPDSRVPEMKEKLSHCLSSKLLRRWCTFEWFYSAIDFPWFAKSEFVEYLNHVRLGHIPTLTRVEWGVIRSSLGKPRRLSKQFLKEERAKLEQYRESVRAHYADLRAGLREGLPTDLARPLFVGQRVIACHPRTRELHGGNVLTIDRNRCRVQFDRTELGVEFVMDIDCMPLNPLDNIPEALRWQNAVLNKFYSGYANLRRDDRSKEWKIGSSLKLAPNDVLETTDGTSHIPTSSHPLNTIMRQAKEDTIDAILQAKATVNEASVAAQAAMYSQPCTLSQIQEREADIRALADLSRALDKKEALLIELRHMNEEVSESQKDGETIKDLEHFRKQYAMVLVQLRDANDQVASALLSLRQRNTYHGNSTHPWVRPLETSGGPPGSQDSLNISAYLTQDMTSPVVEIIETSRRKAKHLVDSAVQVFSTLKEGDDVFTRISEALDFANSRSSGSYANISGGTVPSNAGHGNPTNHDQASCNVELKTVEMLGQKSHSSDVLQVPTELVSSCVSTLLMIQSCTERQYPPAEIAQILDSAVSSLQPSCPQNLPIYREIEACMGIIKNQMLALIPTPCTVPPEIITV